MTMYIYTYIYSSWLYILEYEEYNTMYLFYTKQIK